MPLVYLNFAVTLAAIFCAVFYEDYVNLLLFLLKYTNIYVKIKK